MDEKRPNEFYPLNFRFTVNREDFKDYLRCLKRIALKVLGFKTRQIERKEIPPPPSYFIGMAGEKLTEEILEIIASFQDLKSREKEEISESQLLKRAMVEASEIQNLTAGEEEEEEKVIDVLVKKAIYVEKTASTSLSDYYEKYMEELKKTYEEIIL